jgi:hypothetical protein
MPLYRSISVAKAGDGRRTSFWLDVWVGSEAIGCRWPVLLSHALDRNATVAAVIGVGVRQSMVPRLTAAGERLLPALLALIDGVSLTSVPDYRVLSRCRKKSGNLDTSAFYKLRTWGGVEVPYHAFVWKNFAPSKVQFFAWLLSRSRVQSRAALLKKKILSAAEAGCPICSDPLETANHIFFGCSFVQRFWAAAGFQFPADADVKLLYRYDAPAAVPKGSACTFTLLCLWNLWKHRNAVVFRGQSPCLPLLLKMCRDDALLWRVRLPEALEQAAAAWLQCLQAPVPPSL